MEKSKNSTPSPKGNVSEDVMEKISAYSLRPLSPEEVYVFSVILCDNDIDRDYERFDRAGLEKLAQLFLGKTGIFDHNPKSQNQTARIFDCRVMEDPSRVCSDGTAYHYLKASAYIVRSQQNEPLILDIDAGIKKEVSIGCSVEKSICSICGTDAKKSPCAHRKGKTYDGKLCYHILAGPTDAYEWSFVAVPAQRRAGVTKGYRQEAGNCLEHLLKSLSFGREVTLSPEQSGALGDYLDQLKAGAKLGRQYLEDLKKRVRSLALVCEEAGEAAAFSSLVEKMDLEELKAFEKSFETRLSGGSAPQLAPERNPSQPSPNGEFKI